jgi:anti-sigma B factor antagonist
MPADELITTSVEYRQGVVVLGVSGEIDVNTAPILNTAICEALAGRPSALVLDLSRVRFLSAAGLRVLAQTADQIGGSTHLALVSSGGVVNTVIRLIGLDATFSLYKTVDDALASVSKVMESRN